MLNVWMLNGTQPWGFLKYNKVGGLGWEWQLYTMLMIAKNANAIRNEGVKQRREELWRRQFLNMALRDSKIFEVKV